ncbi:MAG TPA: class D sortase [Pseudogracilibacillus sp.]|nr:class D sortase [Pseudogracilibacillus sp.]
MGRLLSLLFITVGLGLLLYGGFQLFQTYLNEGKRLDEAQSFVSNEVVTEIDENISDNYDFSRGDTIGTLYIPKLDRELPIVEGTDEEELEHGVGHYSDTGYPGENRQILLSGHRDTVFRNFGELEHGDEFHVKMKNGTFIYEFIDHEIVSADDTTVIDLDREDEYLTVSTCYPFSFIGSAPDRFVIYAYPKTK